MAGGPKELKFRVVELDIGLKQIIKEGFHGRFEADIRKLHHNGVVIKVLSQSPHIFYNEMVYCVITLMINAPSFATTES